MVTEKEVLLFYMAVLNATVQLNCRNLSPSMGGPAAASACRCWIPEVEMTSGPRLK